MPTRLDLIAAGCFLSMSMTFYFVRSRIAIFNIVSGSLIVFFTLNLHRFFPETAETVIFLAGLVLYWFGLLLIRIMLRRSVSLRMLENCADGQPIGIREYLVSRLEDLIRFKLVYRHEGIYRPTLFGKSIGLFVSLAYRAVRIQK